MAAFPSVRTDGDGGSAPPISGFLAIMRSMKVAGVLLDADPHRQVAQLGRDPELGRQLARAAASAAAAA